MRKCAGTIPHSTGHDVAFAPVQPGATSGTRGRDQRRFAAGRCRAESGAGVPRGQVLITTRRADVADELDADLHESDVMTPEPSLALLAARPLGHR